MFINALHTECLNLFVMKGKSERQQPPKLNWILGCDQAETLLKYHQMMIRLVLDFTIWARLCR